MPQPESQSLAFSPFHFHYIFHSLAFRPVQEPLGSGQTGFGGLSFTIHDTGTEITPLTQSTASLTRHLDLDSLMSQRWVSTEFYEGLNVKFVLENKLLRPEALECKHAPSNVGRKMSGSLKSTAKVSGGGKPSGWRRRTEKVTGLVGSMYHSVGKLKRKQSEDRARKMGAS